MSEATRAAGIDWTNDESVVRFAVPNLYQTQRNAAIWISREARDEWYREGKPQPIKHPGYLGASFKEARQHPTVLFYEAQHHPVRENLDLMRDTTDAVSGGTERDWPEDFPHENGNYVCRCVTCKQNFIGHKRRVQCKACACKPVAPDSGKDAFEAWWAENIQRIYSLYRGNDLISFKALAKEAWNAALESKPAL